MTHKHYTSYSHVGLVILFVLTGASGCWLLEDDELPALDHSPGFFSDFDQTMDDASTLGSDAENARRLRRAFASYLGEGPSAGEAHATGRTWDKVSTFLEIGLRTADVLGEVQGADSNRVAMYTTAADRVLRSDYAALETWNDSVRDMGRSDAVLAPTGDLVWASLDLILSESEHAVVQRWVESGEWIEGHYERSEGHYEEVWVPGYYDTVWQDGSCWDEWIGTDCEGYWVEDECWDEWVDIGYWDSYCAEYDEWGYCVYYEEYYIDDGYWETYCEPGGYYEDCWDVYETVCEEGGWVEVWIDGYYTRGPWIPGETYWVEGYWEDTSGYCAVVLVEEETLILAEGINVVLELGPEVVGARCHADLESALLDSAESPVEEASQDLRNALRSCLAPN